MSGARGDGGPATADVAAPPRHTMDLIERTVSRILLVGIAVSVALMATGLLLGAVDEEGMPSGVVPLAELPSGLAAPDPAAYLSLGLIVLVATPFVRVAGSMVVFARQRDRRYVLVTAVVFVVMCLSVALGKA